jgi:hypothetical protein
MHVHRAGLFGYENRYNLFARLGLLRLLTIQPIRIKQGCIAVVVMILSLESFAPVIENPNLMARLSFAMPIHCSQADDSRKLVGSASYWINVPRRGRRTSSWVTR